MAWLAIHAGFSVNGVAELHTRLLKEQELHDWYELYPEKFNNKTNGITQRRWLLSANEELSEFITKRIGHGWEKDLTKLKGLEKFTSDKDLNELIAIKEHNKRRLADYLKHAQNEIIDADSIVDVSESFKPYELLSIADIAIGNINAPMLSFTATGKPIFLYTGNTAKALSEIEPLIDFENEVKLPVYNSIYDVINGILDIENYNYTGYNQTKEKYLALCNGNSLENLLNQLK